MNITQINLIQTNLARMNLSQINLTQIKLTRMTLLIYYATVGLSVLIYFIAKHAFRAIVHHGLIIVHSYH